MLHGLLLAAKRTHDGSFLPGGSKSVANIQSSHAHLSYLQVQPEFSSHAFDQRHRLAGKTAQRHVRPNSDLREGSYA
jgi:hypothetical protein